MFVVNEPPPQIGADLVALLRQAEPATIGHFRHVGFMDPGCDRCCRAIASPAPR